MSKYNDVVEIFLKRVDMRQFVCVWGGHSAYKGTTAGVDFTLGLRRCQVCLPKREVEPEVNVLLCEPLLSRFTSSVNGSIICRRFSKKLTNPRLCDEVGLWMDTGCVFCFFIPYGGG